MTGQRSNIQQAMLTLFSPVTTDGYLEMKNLLGMNLQLEARILVLGLPNKV